MKYFVIGITVLYLGCQSVEHSERPENLIPEDKMVDVLADMYISNAAQSVNQWLLKSKNIRLDTYVFERHGIDSLQFAQSNMYYTANLSTYKKLFEKLEVKLALLKEEKDSLKANYDETKRLNTLKRDSIRKNKQDVTPRAFHPHQDSIFP